MAEDLYSDDPAAAGAPPEEAAASEDVSTALLPKAFFPGGDPEPGKECVVRVMRVLDDQVEVEYSTHEEDVPEAPMEEEIQAPAPGGGMTELMG